MRLLPWPVALLGFAQVLLAFWLLVGALVVAHALYDELRGWWRRRTHWRVELTRLGVRDHRDGLYIEARDEREVARRLIRA